MNTTTDVFRGSKKLLSVPGYHWSIFSPNSKYLAIKIDNSVLVFYLADFKLLAIIPSINNMPIKWLDDDILYIVNRSQDNNCKNDVVILKFSENEFKVLV